MRTRVAIDELDVTGYIGRAGPRDAPKRLLAVYLRRSKPCALVPPVTADSGHVEGHEVAQAHVGDLVDEGEVTLLEAPIRAREGHVLWMSSTGPRYEDASEAERELEACAIGAVEQACAGSLASAHVSDLLFGALRVKPTVIANALLVVHFDLIDDTRLLRPLRDDLAELSGRDTGELEGRLLEAARPLLSSSQEIATAVAMEVRRAGRGDLAREILKSVPPTAAAAADPTPPLSWAGTWTWGRS